MLCMNGNGAVRSLKSISLGENKSKKRDILHIHRWKDVKKSSASIEKKKTEKIEMKPSKSSLLLSVMFGEVKYIFGSKKKRGGEVKPIENKCTNIAEAQTHYIRLQQRRLKQ